MWRELRQDYVRARYAEQNADSVANINGEKRRGCSLPAVMAQSNANAVGEVGYAVPGCGTLDGGLNVLEKTISFNKGAAGQCPAFLRTGELRNGNGKGEMWA